eukprot:gnl/MRDRNA2_/MRDRNA2_49320_c0_seq1.p1 gnl/MRDRNA2_/MRDRNA2_49320_c0~~gnl/MRDRNA2_/MRDRNA2_49320_c0_seq1.p1  ORF type:complete len:285 (+),score=29.18 gnl/MRDRNA2_/MRDRNA2_49320_c0_seq1:114-857(+)
MAESGVHIFRDTMVIQFGQNKARYFTIALNITFIAYGQIISVCIGFLTCVKVHGEWIFFHAGKEHCWAGQNIVLNATSLLVLVFFIIPFPVVMYQHCARSSVPEDSVSKAMYIGQTKIYREGCKGYGAVDLARRLLLALLYDVVAWESESLRLTAVAIALCMMMLLHLAWEPYIFGAANALELCCLCILAYSAIGSAVPWLAPKLPPFVGTLMIACYYKAFNGEQQTEKEGISDPPWTEFASDPTLS